jgi:hypothetical protein
MGKTGTLNVLYGKVWGWAFWNLIPEAGLNLDLFYNRYIFRGTSKN